MIWIFERKGRQARVELLYVPPATYELRVVDGDGNEHLEQYTTAEAAGQRQLEWEAALCADGWAKTRGWKL